MTGQVKRRLRRSWHQLRTRRGANLGVPKRLVVKKAAWLNDALSPVVLMVDDLTNAWHSHSNGGQWEHGGDWGGGLDRPGSALRFLEDRLMKSFPEARVTFFTVAGPISSYTRHQPFRYSAPLDADASSRAFFSTLASDPRFELAYHGYNHGTPGECTAGFVQEWRGFASHQAAVTQTKEGLSIFARATGSVPQGGKYGGWEYNDLADDAVDASGFTWWCRDWMPRDVTTGIADEYYEPQFFGRNRVVALPSTVHGHFWDPRQIDRLLAHQQLVSIEEHIAPLRPDGLIQTPNIVDDIDDLRRLYRYLRGKNVWHANGSAIASYVIARERTLIHDVTRDGFSIAYDGRVERPLLTLLIDGGAICTSEKPFVDVTAPDGRVADPPSVSFDRERRRHVVTVPVIEGRYQVRARA